ncbi:MAG: hypothetical protein ACI9G1_005588, partial [Pirellulaceae bacterium]
FTIRYSNIGATITTQRSQRNKHNAINTTQ